MRIFNDFDSITVDGDGQVFVLDGQAQHIRVFDSEGAYVETVARRGEGPGELSNASSVAVLPDGRIMAHEPGDMLVKVLGPLPRDRALWTYTSGAIVIPVKPLRIDDAFEPDGTYLGTLAVPDDFVTRPEPIFDGDHVWAVEGYRGKSSYLAIRHGGISGFSST